MGWGDKYLAEARADKGAAEKPLGSNCGREIRKFKDETWLDPDACWPWCVGAWQEWTKRVFKKRFPYPTASVEQLAAYCRAHNLTVPVGNAKLGDAACLGGEHITLIAKKGRPQFTGLGGNQSHRVQESSYAFERVTTVISADKVAEFLGFAGKPPVKPKPHSRPTFEIIRGEGGQEKIVATMSDIKAVQKKVGQLLGRGVHGLRIRKVPPKSQ
jgi:hypothetical protein